MYIIVIHVLHVEFNFILLILTEVYVNLYIFCYVSNNLQHMLITPTSMAVVELKQYIAILIEIVAMKIKVLFGFEIYYLLNYSFRNVSFNSPKCITFK